MLKALMPTAVLTDGIVMPPAPSLLERLKAMVTRTSAPQGDDAIAAFVQANGGVLTDQLEREISRRFGASVGG
jgi:hypothetical protein